ncbi:MAG: hypothetical protein FJY95_04195 [Candidatus Handelsmanbacteria bacterium]|nr:hypothetical protein [Candidatus Handelsmanbacteria bacterium]
MKSALELALEKADAELGQDKDYVKLSPEQIAAIDQLKKQYEAKWAEQEIALKAKIQKLSRELEPQAFAEHQQQFQGEMKRVRDQIFAERDQKIEALRKQK